MLERVRVQNFRSCRDVTLEGFPPVLALIGRNGAGKTNIMHSIAWGAARATKSLEGFRDVALSQDPEVKTTVTLDVRLGDRCFRYRVAMVYLMQPSAVGETPVTELLLEESIAVETSRAPQRWDKILTRENEALTSKDGDAAIGQTTPAMVALAALRPDSRIVAQTAPLFEFLSKIAYDSLDEPNDSSDPAGSGMIEADTYLKWIASNPRTASVPMRLLHAWRTNRGAFDELAQLLGPNGLGVLDTLVVNELPYRVPSTARATEQPGSADRLFYLVFARPANSGDGDILPYNHLSLGTRRLIRILVAMLFDANTVLMLEQPEDSIHGALLRKVISLLGTYSDRTSLIVSSHSSAVLNEIPAEALRLVAMESGSTSVRSLSQVERQAAQRFMENEGALSDFLEAME